MALEQQHEPCLVDEPSRPEAEKFVRLLVQWVGPGFHPDTDFHDYITVDMGTRSFPPTQAKRLNAKLDRAVAVLEHGGGDVYEIAAPVQHALLAPYLSRSSLAG